MIAKPDDEGQGVGQGVEVACPSGKTACSQRSMSAAKAGSPTQPMPSEVSVTPNCTVPR